jgi:ArsR family transcriptional regulator, arsenate/arsenite/antimonite-responsive transcriptional repressor
LQYLAKTLNIVPVIDWPLATKKKALAERELEEFDLVFKALAHPSRRNILVNIHSRGGRMIAGEIVKRFSYKWPTITRHLQQLEQAGLLTSVKEGREWTYEINAEKLKTVVNNWLKWF